MGKDAAVWTDASVIIFCDLCIIEVDKGNRPHTHFTKEGWVNLVRDFKTDEGKVYTRKQLKNKWDALKDQWKTWKELKGKETGLGWDHNKQTVDASDEWWESKMKKNAEYAKLRKKGIPPVLEERLDRLFSTVIATGEHAWTPSSSLPLPKDNTGEDLVVEVGDSDEVDDVAEPEEGKKRRSQRLEDAKCKGVGTKKGKLGGSAKLSQQIDRMVEAFESKSTASSMTIKKLQEDETTSITSIMNQLKTIPGMGTTTPLWHFATDLILKKEMREILANMKDDPEGMKSWLVYQMNKN